VSLAKRVNALTVPSPPGLVHRAATGARRAAGTAGSPSWVRRHHQGRRAGGVGSPGTAALVRVHPQRQRRPHRGPSNLGHSGTSVTETVYRHEIGLRSPKAQRPARL